MFIHDGVPYFHFGAFFFAIIIAVAIIFVVHRHRAWRTEELEPLLVLHTIYWLEDNRHPTSPGCTLDEIGHSCGGLTNILVPSLPFLVEDLVRLGALKADETGNLRLTPAGKRILEHGYPKSRPSQPPPPDDGHAA